MRAVVLALNAFRFYVFDFSKPMALSTNPFRKKFNVSTENSLVKNVLSQTSSFTRPWAALKKAGVWFLKWPIWKKDRTKILARCSIHLPPLIITGLLAYINFATVFFSPLGTANQTLQINGLQVAAKVHEVTFIASLSIIAIDFVQYELLRGKGLSISGVLAAFQLTNLINLWSRGLWDRCCTTGFRVQRIQFVVLVAFLMIMTLILGPSSSILMLPTVGWWDIRASIMIDGGSEHGPVSFFLYGNDSLIWPTLVTTMNYNLSDCTAGNNTPSLPVNCPTAGLPLMLAQAWDTDNLTTWSLAMPTSYSTPSTPVYTREIQGIVCGENRVALTKSSVSSVDNALTTIFSTATIDPLVFPNSAPSSENDILAWNLTLQNGSQVLGPQAFVLCSLSVPPFDAANQPSPWAVQELTFPLRGGQNWSTDAAPLISLWNSTGSAALWVEPPYLYNNTPSILFAFVANDDIETCSVYASWSPGDISATLNGNTISLTSSTVASDLAYWNSCQGTHCWDCGLDNWALYNQSGSGVREVQLDVNWANLALPPELTMVPLIEKLETSTASAALSLLVTDACNYHL
jgi:hypothetical protein